jgi:hypothetical protein
VLDPALTSADLVLEIVLDLVLDPVLVPVLVLVLDPVLEPPAAGQAPFPSWRLTLPYPTPLCRTASQALAPRPVLSPSAAGQ